MKRISRALGVHLVIASAAFPAIAHAQGRLNNPLGDDVTIPGVIGRVVSALLGISGALALLMFVYGGVLWMTSGGNPDKIQKGKQTLVWAVIGLVVIFTAQTLVRVVIQALTTGTAS